MKKYNLPQKLIKITLTIQAHMFKTDITIFKCTGCIHVFNV